MFTRRLAASGAPSATHRGSPSVRHRAAPEKVVSGGAECPSCHTVSAKAYDNAGDVLSIKDLTNQYGAGPDDNQCFTYDYFQRLSAAWTPGNGNCAVGGCGG